MMKKVLATVLAAALAAGTMIMPAMAAESTGLLAEIQERGKIIVATEGAWAPWTYHDEDMNLVGFDVEVAAAIAEKLGVEVEFKETEWSGIFAGLDAGHWDIVANGVEITDERAEKYDFSDPYAFTHTALIVRDDNEDITTFADLEGKKVANSLNSTYALLAEANGANAIDVEELGQCLEQVIQGRVDATLNADVSFYDYMNQKEDAPIKVVALTEECDKICIPVRKGEESADLIAAINKAIAELAEEGVLTELSVKYFGNDISKEVVE
ncbi:MAG: transporter substrate-binding domain-containing protein [Clostridiales bacterium]|nr:transporter substrate-binding domain-containing protein [Candidatus Blautia equi]